MSRSNCCFLTCTQISQEASHVVWYSHLFQNFPQFVVIHIVKSFGIVNNAEIDVFLELSHFFDDPMDVGNLISGSSAFSKSSLNIWKFLVHVLLKPGLENFEHYFASMWDESNCAVVWAFFESNKYKNILCTPSPRCQTQILKVNGSSKLILLNLLNLLKWFQLNKTGSWNTIKSTDIERRKRCLFT